MQSHLSALLTELDHFDAARRITAREELVKLLKTGALVPGTRTPAVNLHLHSFHSYNAKGYSPTSLAWQARQAGLAVAGIVDFDVLNGLDEFEEAGAKFDVKTCAGIETRVFVPELASVEINSPGEPGIAYHMGVGFPRAQVPVAWQEFLRDLRERSARRTSSLVARVNTYLAPVELDFSCDVLPLTPSGNATERHVCFAYARKAQTVFRDSDELAEYWGDKLSCEPDTLDLPGGPRLQDRIRSKTMKRGGVGYVQPAAGAFPKMAEMNAFILACGGIPTYAWLNGCSDGERDLEKLLDLGRQSGVAAINVIPARNYTPGLPDEKLSNLQALLSFAEERGIPVVVGTEMNSPGQPFVDDFNSVELRPFVPFFLRSAYQVFAHASLERVRGWGYLSPWAQAMFTQVCEKNEFFEEFGRRWEPECEDRLLQLSAQPSPQAILSVLP